jgi:hypothetical protein
MSAGAQKNMVFEPLLSVKKEEIRPIQNTIRPVLMGEDALIKQ